MKTPESSSHPSPSSELRILVVDDSVAVRRALTEAIEREPGMSLCGAAPNGALGLELLSRTNPDVIVLDLAMPVVDGLDFLTRMRPEYPRLPVLVFSGTVGHANEATLEALWRGASDYLLKPEGLPPGAMDAFLRAQLFPRLRALVQPRAGSSVRPATAAAPPPAPLDPRARPAEPVAFSLARPAAGPDPLPSMLVVGASTGGPRALAAAVGELPRDYALPIAIVQHMPAEMTEFFAAGLAANCRLPVRIAEDRGAVSPGVIWVAPGGTHLVLEADRERVRFRLDTGPEENGCRPAVDPLFRSAAHVYGPGTLALVLTGMGQDGLAGARAVHAAQGRVLVQDEASSVVWGMPGAVARAGLAHAILPLSLLGGELRARARRILRALDGDGPQAEAA